ncbi:hypothetical protein [Flavobacterium sp.]|uniref:hypothetical protein n=1 Tax=Flavobacterium sp. TaxID=239 RepID=UPI0026117EF5|nr:hypothetical protein [Flavobacterium sp.]
MESRIHEQLLHTKLLAEKYKKSLCENELHEVNIAESKFGNNLLLIGVGILVFGVIFLLHEKEKNNKRV